MRLKHNLLRSSTKPNSEGKEDEDEEEELGSSKRGPKSPVTIPLTTRVTVLVRGKGPRTNAIPFLG